jgi:hypothetical protein
LVIHAKYVCRSKMVPMAVVLGARRGFSCNVTSVTRWRKGNAIQMRMVMRGGFQCRMILHVVISGFELISNVYHTYHAIQA